MIVPTPEPVHLRTWRQSSVEVSKLGLLQKTKQSIVVEAQGIYIYISKPTGISAICQDLSDLPTRPGSSNPIDPPISAPYWTVLSGDGCWFTMVYM